MKLPSLIFLLSLVTLLWMAGNPVSAESTEGLYKNGSDALFAYVHGFGDSSSLKLANFWFDKVLGIDPNHTDTWYDKGRVLTLQGEFNEAIEAFNKTLAIDPNYPDAWAYTGSAMVFLGRFSEALEAFDRELENHPGSGFALEQKANTLSMLGRYDEAIEVYDKIMLDSETTLTGKGIALKNLGRYDEAMNCFNKALRIDPKFLKAQEEKKSIQHLVNVTNTSNQTDVTIEGESENSSTWIAIANDLTNQGKYKDAVEAYEKALEIDPNNVGALKGKKTALDELNNSGNFNGSNKPFESSGTDTTQILLDKGEYLSDLGQFEEAVDIYEQVIKTSPDNVGALSGLGFALFNLERYDEALELSERLLKIDPENIDALNGKGILLSNLGKYDDAIEVFTQATRIDSENADIWNNMGALFTELGRYEEALYAYDQVLKINPENADARANRKAVESKLN